MLNITNGKISVADILKQIAFQKFENDLKSIQQKTGEKIEVVCGFGYKIEGCVTTNHDEGNFDGNVSIIVTLEFGTDLTVKNCLFG